MSPSQKGAHGPRTTSETDTSDLARGAGVNYVGYVARLGSRVPFLMFAGLLYGETRFGVYTFGITLVETVAAISLFGMRQSLYKLMSDEVAERGHAYRAIAHGVVLALAAAVIGTLAVAAGSGVLAEVFRFPSARGQLLIFSPAILFITLSDILLVAIRFTRQMRFEVYARSLAEPITLTLVSVITYVAGMREYGLAVAYVTSLGVAAVLSVWFFCRVYSLRRCIRTRLEWRQMRRLVEFSAPTAGYDLLLKLADKIDIFLVSYFLPTSAVGVYGMARQFSTPTKKIRAGFEGILGPVLADSLAAGAPARAQHQIVLVTRWILTVEVLLVVFFAFYAGDLLGLLAGGFGAGATTLVLLILADTINGSLGVSEFAAVYLRPRVNVVLGGVTLLVGVVANTVLIQAFGLEGAGTAVLLTAILVNVVRVVVNKRSFGLVTIDVCLLKPILAAVPAGAAVWFVQRIVPGTGALDMLVGVPVLIATYLIGLAALGLEAEDHAQLERVRAAFRK